VALGTGQPSENPDAVTVTNDELLLRLPEARRYAAKVAGWRFELSPEELTSVAWEGLFDGARYHTSSKGDLVRYCTPAIRAAVNRRAAQQGFGVVRRSGGDVSLDFESGDEEAEPLYLRLPQLQSAATPALDCERRELYEWIVKTAKWLLNAQEFAALLLTAVEGMTAKEVSTITGDTPYRVAKNRTEALRKVRQSLTRTLKINLLSK
jgi:hypothetical protein